MLSTLENLFNLARERKKNPIDGSYTNRLLNDKSLSKSKVLEEINKQKNLFSHYPPMAMIPELKSSYKSYLKNIIYLLQIVSMQEMEIYIH